MSCRCILLSLLLVAAVAPRPGRAADPAPEVLQARSLSEEARREYELGHFADAATLYESAYKLKPVPALLFNIGQCRRQLADTRGAVLAYRAFLRGDPEHPSAETARELLAQLEPALEKSAPQPAPPAAVPNPPVAQAQAIAHPAPTPRSHTRWPALAAAGTAAALLGVAVAESFAAKSATDQLAQLHQQNSAVSAADDARLRADAESKHSRAQLLYALTAVAAVAGVGLYFAF